MSICDICSCKRNEFTGLVTGKPSIRPPWLQITENQEDYVSAEYIPELFTLREPSRLKVSEKASLLDFWRAWQNDPQIKYTFLWTAYQEGEHMIANDYAIPSNDTEDSDQLLRNKPKKGTRKGKGKTASKAGKMRATAVDDGNTQDSEPATMALINTVTQAKLVGKGQSKTTSLPAPESQPLELSIAKASGKKTEKPDLEMKSETARPKHMNHGVDVAESSEKVNNLVREPGVQPWNDQAATSPESDSSTNSESDFEDGHRLVGKKLSQSKGKGKGKGKGKPPLQSGKMTAPMADDGNNPEIASDTMVLIKTPPKSNMMGKGKSKGAKPADPEGTSGRAGCNKGHQTINMVNTPSSNNEADSDATMESAHGNDPEGSSQSDSMAESIIPPDTPKTMKRAKKKSVVTKKPELVKPKTKTCRPTVIKKPAGNFEVGEDLTGISRHRTPSRKQLEMEAENEIVPALGNA